MYRCIGLEIQLDAEREEEVEEWTRRDAFLTGRVQIRNDVDLIKGYQNWSPG